MLIKRILMIVPTTLIVLLMAMLLLELTPTDPATLLAGENASPEHIADVRSRLGLDENLVGRYWEGLTGMIQGDLGSSFRDGQPVTDIVADALPITMSLLVVALFMAVVIAVPAGVLAALHQGRWIDRFLTAISSVVIAIPAFVFALVLVIVFALQLELFPAIGYTHFGDDPVQWLRDLTLPSIALALPAAAELARQVRGAFIDTMSQDFIKAQYAKGLPQSRVLLKHVGKNSAVPFVTVLGLQVGRLIGGALIVEIVFAIPGFGFTLYGAVVSHDYPVIQGAVIASSIAISLVNLLVDLSYLYFSPETRAANA